MSPYSLQSNKRGLKNAAVAACDQLSEKMCLKKYGRCALKIHLRKKRLESKLRRKYVLNLLNEPQNLTKRNLETSLNSKRRRNKFTRMKAQK